MPTEEQIKKFRERLEQPLRQDAADELESGIPSLMRAEIALRKFRDMPHRIVEGVMDELWPNVSRGFAKEIVETIIDFAERNEDKGLGLNPQRIEWLKRWADEQGEKYIVTTEDDERIKAAYQKAIEKGIMSKFGDRYEWKRSKILLSYFIGRLKCGDVVSSGKWVPVSLFPNKYVEELFLINKKPALNVGDSRKAKKSSSGNPPIGYEEIDKCIDSQ